MRNNCKEKVKRLLADTFFLMMKISSVSIRRILTFKEEKKI